MKLIEKYTQNIIYIKDYNFIIDWRNFSDQLIKNDFRTHDKIRSIPPGQGDDYSTGCLLHYNYL